MAVGVDYSKFFPMVEYYEKMVMPLDRKYRQRSGGSSPKFVCCLHNDHDPSLNFRKTKTGEVYRCFGCNLSGDIIDFHTKVSHLYYNKRFTDKDSVLKDLCRLFNVDYRSLPTEALLENTTDRALRTEVVLRDAMNQWDFGDFKSGIITGKMENQGVAYYNTLLIQMIDHVKSKDI